MARGHKKNRDYESGYKSYIDDQNDEDIDQEGLIEKNKFNKWAEKEPGKPKEELVQKKQPKKKAKLKENNTSNIQNYDGIKSVDIKNILDGYLASKGNTKRFKDIVSSLGYHNVILTNRENEIEIEWNGKRYKFFKLN
jgi:hypothetical protein